MHFNKRYAYALMLISSLLLTGFDGFQCTNDNSRKGNSSDGSTDTGVRVGDEQKISASSGSFNGNLQNGDQFGSAVADPGDLEADDVRDLAVGAPFADDDGNDKGAVWILFMDPDGRVDQQQRISGNAGGFEGNLVDNDLFGSAVAGVGDRNFDSAFDLAVGAPGNDGSGVDRGGIWILYLDATGKVRQQQRIAEGAGGFGGHLDDDDRFGSAIADIGDVNGDRITDLAVGAPNDDDGADNAGAVWILMMNMDGRVEDWQKVSASAGGFTGNLDADDHFGAAVAGIGDFDNDGIAELAVGAPGNDGSGEHRGEIWILYLDAKGRVRQQRRIAENTGGFGGNLDKDDRFGSAIADIGDINGDGIADLAVGAPNDDDGANNAGAVWILLMKTDGTVDDWQKVSDRAGGFGGNLDAEDHFGAAISGIGNLDNSGLVDLAVGAPGDNDGGPDQGAVWILFLE